MAASSTVSYCIPPPLPESDDGNVAGASGSAGMVLLDRWCSIADLVKATTAEGTTSTGLRIQVTFRAAPPPPLVSHFCVHCPGLDFPNAVPKVVATDANLVLLCVPVNPDTTGHPSRNWDYFVYGLRARRLDLVPNPNPRCLMDSATVLLSRRQDEDGGGAGWYAIAALGAKRPVYNGGVLVRCDFELHLYKSSNSEEGWISKMMSVDGLVRDKLVPLPNPIDYRLYHETDKAVVIGGEGGTVAWVDLWRGIFFCDVLSERPVLQDVPLPAPARGNWNLILMENDPYCFRDVTVSGRDRDCIIIKYIEMEYWSPTADLDMTTTPAASYESYSAWVRSKSGRLRVTGRDGWKATTWTMRTPVDPDSQPWHRCSEIHVKDVTLQLDDASNACPPSNLLPMLCDSKTLAKELNMSRPIISMDDDDVVYLHSTIKPRHMVDKFEVVLAIDVGKGVLRGLAEVNAQNLIFKANIFSSDICRYLRKDTGTVKACI